VDTNNPDLSLVLPGSPAGNAQASPRQPSLARVADFAPRDGSLVVGQFRLAVHQDALGFGALAASLVRLRPIQTDNLPEFCTRLLSGKRRPKSQIRRSTRRSRAPLERIRPAQLN
jgi:hypothetical protein